MKSGWVERLYAVADDTYVRTRILHGYGALTDRALGLYEDAVQEAAAMYVQSTRKPETDAELAEFVITTARSWIGKELSEAAMANHPCPQPRRRYEKVKHDYPEAFLRLLSAKVRDCYRFYVSEGRIDLATQRNNMTENAVRVSMHRLKTKYERWCMRLPYDPSIEANMRMDKAALADAYKLKVKDCCTVPQISEAIGLPYGAVVELLREVRARMPYGGKHAPTGYTPLRIRASKKT